KSSRDVANIFYFLAGPHPRSLMPLSTSAGALVDRHSRRRCCESFTFWETRMRGFCLAVFFAALAATASAQQADDPVLGNWRGTIKAASGTESQFVLTIIKKGDGYAGSMSGLGGTSEIPLKSITAAAGRVTVESGDTSKLGQITLTGDLA